MATPESSQYYTPSSGDCWVLQVLDRLRGLLAADPLLDGWFDGTIRQFPVTSALEKNAAGVLLPAVVSLHAPMAFYTTATTMGEVGVGKTKASVVAALTMTFAEPQNEDADGWALLHRRCWNTTEKFRTALLRYREDTTPGAPLWNYMLFPQHTPEGGGKPTAMIFREVGVAYRAIIEFTLTSHQRTI